MNISISPQTLTHTQIFTLFHNEWMQRKKQWTDTCKMCSEERGKMTHTKTERRELWRNRVDASRFSYIKYIACIANTKHIIYIFILFRFCGRYENGLLCVVNFQLCTSVSTTMHSFHTLFMRKCAVLGSMYDDTLIALAMFIQISTIETSKNSAMYSVY